MELYFWLSPECMFCGKSLFLQANIDLRKLNDMLCFINVFACLILSTMMHNNNCAHFN